MANNSLIVYEGAMCCSTGLCGPEPDKILMDFSEAIKKLQKEFTEFSIIRASISFNIKMFQENKEIFQLVKENGQKILPITTINGRIIAKQRYLAFDELRNELHKITEQV